MGKQVESDDEQFRRAARERTFRRYLHINKQLLEELYYTQNLSTKEIAHQLGVSRNVIWEYMEMYDLKRRQAGIAGAMKSRKHHCDERFFAQIRDGDDDKAYIIGLILGDGTLIDRGSAKRLQIALADSDGDLLESIALRMGDVTMVKRNIPPNTPSEQPKALLRIDSTTLVNDLANLGVPIGKKSGQEPFLKFKTDRLTWSFVRGVFDADGCIRVYERSGVVKGKMYGPYRRAKCSITCGESFVRGLRDFLYSQDFVLGEKCLQPKQGTGLIEIANQQTIRAIGKAMYQYGSLYLLRKKCIFETLV